MGKETLLKKIKHIIYKIIKPIYLWSINYKTLEDYITDIEKEYLNMTIIPTMTEWRRGMPITTKNVDAILLADKQIHIVLNKLKQKI